MALQSWIWKVTERHHHCKFTYSATLIVQNIDYLLVWLLYARLKSNTLPNNDLYWNLSCFLQIYFLCRTLNNKSWNEEIDWIKIILNIIRTLYHFYNSTECFVNAKWWLFNIHITFCRNFNCIWIPAGSCPYFQQSTMDWSMDTGR